MINLYKHQRDAIGHTFGCGGSAALFMDMGTGKTLTALEIFRQHRLTGDPSMKMIVIAPLSLLEAAWGEDIKRFTEFTYYNAHERPIPAMLKGDILLINYDAVITKRNAALFPLMRGNMVVLDESSRCKNFKAKTTKTLLASRLLPKYKLIMSGTPAPNTPMEYWAQMEWLRPGILHKSFYGFRNTYFHLQRGNQIYRGQVFSRAAMFDAMHTGFKYEITAANLKKLMNKISPYIFLAKKENCLDLPEQIDEARKVALSPAQLKHYKEMKNYLITEIKGQMITGQNALTKIMKLQEIISGFCFDSFGKICEIQNGDSKYKELLDTIEEIGDKQIIIWCRFQYEIKKIMKLLPNSCSLYGETKDKEDSINGFKEGRYKYLIANTHSGGHGLTFTNCNYMIYFSIDYSWESMEQSRNRNHRIGQTQKCTYIYLLGADTIEEDIFDIVKKKGEMNKLVERLLK